jgi:endonuclease/exonuclease/phosphatase family metal-dependent hydrolase
MAQRQQQPVVSCLLISGIAVLLVVATYFAPDLHSPALFVLKAGLQPITAMILATFVIFAAYTRNSLLSIATLLACLINAPFLLPKFSQITPNKPQSSDVEFTAATFSTLTRTNTVDDIIKFIKSENPHLLCLQELSPSHRQRLLKQLDGHYAYHIENNNNQLTLSHYPLLPDEDLGHYLVSILDHPAWGQIEVINTHMPRPYLSVGVEGSWEKLLKRLNSQRKTLLCGDLNTTPNNSLYDLLRFQYSLTDSLSSGYGFTFPNAQRKSALFGPLIRIDYIFIRGMSAHNTRTINASKLSDHRAIVTNIVLNDPGHE